MVKLLHIIFLHVLLFFTPLAFAEPIKIGVAGSFSGDNTNTGKYQWEGALLAVENINKEGGINGDQIVLIQQDTSCNVNQSLLAAQRLIKDEVIAVIGHVCSDASIAASELYAPAHVVMITPASTNPVLTEQGYNNVFRTCGRDDNQGVVAANFIVNDLKLSKIILVHDSSVYGLGLAKSIKESFEKLGVSVVLIGSITRGQKNIKNLIDKIKSTSADVLYYAGLDTDAGCLLNQLRKSNNKIIFFSGDAISTPGFVEMAGGPEIVNNTYFTFTDPLASTQAKKVLGELEKQKITPTGFTLNSYAAVEAVAEAIKKTRSRDKQVIAQWLHANKVSTIIGDLKWDEKGDLQNIPFQVYKWNDQGVSTRVK